jgi:hypothetical protein
MSFPGRARDIRRLLGTQEGSIQRRLRRPTIPVMARERRPEDWDRDLEAAREAEQLTNDWTTNPGWWSSATSRGLSISS